VEFLTLPFGSAVVFAAGNFTVASAILLRVGVLINMNCFPVLEAWLVTTPTGRTELAAE
jgi:hypothetical protein